MYILFSLVIIIAVLVLMAIRKKYNIGFIIICFCCLFYVIGYSTCKDFYISKEKEYKNTIVSGNLSISDNASRIDNANNISLNSIKNKGINSLTVQTVNIKGNKAEKIVQQWDETGKRYTAYLGYSSSKPIKELSTDNVSLGYEYLYDSKSRVRELTKKFKAGSAYKDVFGNRKDFYKENNGLDSILSKEWVKKKGNEKYDEYECSYGGKDSKTKCTLTVDKKIWRVIKYTEVATNNKGENLNKLTKEYTGYNSTVIESIE